MSDEFDKYGMKAWAWRLKAKEEAGIKLGKAQRDCWREALKTELAQVAQAQPATSTDDSLDEAKYRAAMKVADYVRERHEVAA